MDEGVAAVLIVALSNTASMLVMLAWWGKQTGLWCITHESNSSSEHPRKHVSPFGGNSWLN